MRTPSLGLAALLVTVLAAGSAQAQGTVIILDTTVEGDINEAVADQFRAALTRGLSENTDDEVLSPAATRARLGPNADLLMACGTNADCLVQAGEQSGAQAAIVAAVGEAADIYAFTVDVYDLATGEGVYFTDADCPLCTIDEAIATFEELAVEAAAALEEVGAEPTPPQVVRGETITLFIRTEPASAAIWLNGEPVGTGIVEAAVGPGAYQLSVSADGFQRVEQTIIVAPGDDDKVVNVRLEPEAAATPATARRQGGLVDDIDTTVTGSILTGVGLASVVTGIVLLALDGDTTCPEGAVTACEEVYETTAGGTVLTVLGASSLTAGVVLLLWNTLAGPPAPAPSEAGGAARVDVGFSDESGFVRVLGQF